MESLSRDQVRRVDRYAMDVLGVSGLVLMENAGRNAAEAIEAFLGNLTDKKIAIVAGSGNNGGDGFVIARHLAMRGACVATFLVAPREKIRSGGDSAVNFSILEKLGYSVRPLADQGRVASLAEQLNPFDVVIDAVGGTGIQGSLRGELPLAVEQINLAGKPVVAVDIPTGLDCDTGQPNGPTVRAKLTITMHARKKGFDHPASRSYTGEVRVVDIGIPLGMTAEDSPQG